MTHSFAKAPLYYAVCATLKSKRHGNLGKKAFETMRETTQPLDQEIDAPGDRTLLCFSLSRLLLHGHRRGYSHREHLTTYIYLNIVNIVF